MRAGRLAGAIGGAVMFFTALSFIVYLWRGEWDRALLAGVLFIAIEVAMATAMVLSRLRRMEGLLQARDPAVLARIRETAAAPRDHFEWLSPRADRFSVFVPVLIAMGVVASALAWLVERVARVTAGPALERDLAARLGALAWPAGGLVPDRGDDQLSILEGPAPMR